MKEAIINILDSTGQNWQFTDLRIKLSPHTPVIDIRSIENDNGWIVKWNNGYGLASMPLVEIENRETLATIYQRIKLITNGSKITNSQS